MGEVANIKGHNAEQKITTKLCKKLCQDSKKVGKTAPGIPEQPLWKVLGFKGIQTLQVLEAQIAI